MRKPLVLITIVFVLFTSFVSADTFGTGSNQFTIDFVPISGNSNPTSGIPAGEGFTFTGVANDYRMGTYEVTNAQWTKFKAAYGEVTGAPSNAYDQDPYWAGENIPTNRTSWYEAAQFVNYLNTSKGYQAAYKFTGTQGTSNYTLGIWSTAEAAGGTNLYRNKNAKYYLPTEDEWMKAAHWNGSNLQTYTTIGDVFPLQGNGTSGTGWNYYNNTDLAQYINLYRPWDVGSGSQELNGTFDMTGNVYEWMESPWNNGDYLSGSIRGLRGGSYGHGGEGALASYGGSGCYPDLVNSTMGFRVASVPEPATLLLLGLGGLLIRYRK
jgi:formylglycine-generating enzyme required for sulfatase activity